MLNLLDLSTINSPASSFFAGDLSLGSLITCARFNDLASSFFDRVRLGLSAQLKPLPRGFIC